jgi:hypothetical protein
MKIDYNVIGKEGVQHLIKANWKYLQKIILCLNKFK